MDALFTVPEPHNEPVGTLRAGQPRTGHACSAALPSSPAERLDLTMTIDGTQRMGGGDAIDVVQPHRHRHVLGVTHNATNDDAAAAVAAAKRAAPMWRALPYEERAAIFLRAADLLAGPWRDTLNGATMLGQSKTCYQAEIDSACELIDFLRFNVHFGQQLLADQPRSSRGVWNRFDHRPLEGFVFAITPFNFTAIAGNLPTAPALMGNTVVWKPSVTQQLAAHYIDAPARGGRAAARRHQHGHRPRPGGERGRAGRSRLRRPALHRLDGHVPAPVAADRRPTSTRTARTRASSARPAARTSSSRTRAPTSTRCTPR